MNKILFLILAFILIACSPQATVTSPPPTETPIPTPTLHPDFVALQDLIADSSDRFTLLPDGTIEETTGDGKRIIPNLHVDQNGIINIIFNNEHVAIEQSQITFDDENGLIIDGYELNENGEWVEAVSEAMQIVTGLIDQYGVDPETVTVTEKNGVVSVTDNETGKVIMESDGTTTRYSLEFAVDGIAAKSCEPTPFKPSKSGFMSGDPGLPLHEYIEALLKELKYQHVNEAILRGILINRVDQCWAFVLNNKDMLYRDSEGVAHRLRLLPITDQEVFEFQTSR